MAINDASSGKCNTSIVRKKKCSHALEILPKQLSVRAWRVQMYTAAIFLRLFLILFSEWQDANFTVKYTDVDYRVFTDAAQLLLNRKSPYDRRTYRYSPIIAYVATTNLLIAASFCKYMFAMVDILTGFILETSKNMFF
ncbi:mannosyltransferase (pig-m) protein [Cardiosporidium cionae]|uniref:GPI mannosyltransferase I n=1 Tax=Cardiosporidium cionae TaxID=476202 RepID=A0ABQ7J9R4_9APIC|nr:mannosyltransferase (pig-m) protein [Cardiosporidium cionae]|eukprot:KAF8820390.1 mannosyltransferase (pig-m) protein [Cardiosporidium cionae]